MTENSLLGYGDLLAEARRIYGLLRAEMRANWDRDLPIEELLFDRWERARSLGFGDGSSIYHSCHVYGHVRVGAHTWIGPFTVLDGTGGLEIGNHCNISAGVQIYSHDTVASVLTAGEEPTRRSGVRLGDRCYVGPQTVISKGVSVGDGTVVGACSLVNRDLPAGVFAFGVPCRPQGPAGDFVGERSSSS